MQFIRRRKASWTLKLRYIRSWHFAGGCYSSLTMQETELGDHMVSEYIYFHGVIMLSYVIKGHFLREVWFCTKDPPCSP